MFTLLLITPVRFSKVVHILFAFQTSNLSLRNPLKTNLLLSEFRKFPQILSPCDRCRRGWRSRTAEAARSKQG